MAIFYMILMWICGAMTGWVVCRLRLQRLVSAEIAGLLRDALPGNVVPIEGNGHQRWSE